MIDVSTLTMLRRFVPWFQMNLLLHHTRGEEKEGGLRLLSCLAAHIQNMPMTRQTERASDPVAYLHYFGGACDAWILERDACADGCPPGLGPQYQAFGWVDFGHGPELGYVSLPELMQAGLEVDLHWDPKPMSEVLRNRNQHQGTEHAA